MTCAGANRFRGSGITAAGLSAVKDRPLCALDDVSRFSTTTTWTAPDIDNDEKFEDGLKGE